MKTKTLPTLPELAESLGFAITSSAPVGAVDPAHGKEGKPWPHILYTSTITQDGKPVWSGPYKLGVGHVKMPARMPGGGYRLAEIEAIMGKAPKDTATMESEVAARLAVRQKVTPALPDVLQSLLSDGQAHFDRPTFEDWCSETGMDENSRSAEKTFNACVEIGRSLARAIPAAELAQLREAANEF